jgi:hypothetical protein
MWDRRNVQLAIPQEGRMYGVLRRLAQVCAFAAFFAVVTLSFRACLTVQLPKEHPVFSFVAEHITTHPVAR